MVLPCFFIKPSSHQEPLSQKTQFNLSAPISVHGFVCVCVFSILFACYITHNYYDLAVLCNILFKYQKKYHKWILKNAQD